MRRDCRLGAFRRIRDRHSHVKSNDCGENDDDDDDDADVVVVMVNMSMFIPMMLALCSKGR